MNLIPEEQIVNAGLRRVAEEMLIAARTAPKGRGRNNLYLALAEGETIRQLAERMNAIALDSGEAFFARDAGNILNSTVLVLAGTRIQSLGLKVCGMCGFAGCEEKNEHPDIPCSFNTADLGIAVGSAVSVAMDHRVDNRIMYTVGQAAMQLGILPPEIKIAYGIPLSATSKNPFFDRGR